MKKNILVAASSFVLGAALFIGLTGTMAANTENGSFAKGENRARFALNEEQRLSIENAINSGDYQAWKELHAGIDNEITQKINEGNFTRFTEAQKLMTQSRENMESARAIMEELGIEKGFGKGPGKGMGGPRGQMKGDCPCQGGLQDSVTAE